MISRFFTRPFFTIFLQLLFIMSDDRHALVHNNKRMRIVFEHNVFQLADLVLGHENVKHVRLFIRVSARAFQTSNSSVHLLQDFLLQSRVVQLRDNPHLDVNVL